MTIVLAVGAAGVAGGIVVARVFGGPQEIREIVQDTRIEVVSGRAQLRGRNAVISLETGYARHPNMRLAARLAHQFRNTHPNYLARSPPKLFAQNRALARIKISQYLHDTTPEAIEGVRGVVPADRERILERAVLLCFITRECQREANEDWQADAIIEANIPVEYGRVVRLVWYNPSTWRVSERLLARPVLEAQPRLDAAVAL